MSTQSSELGKNYKWKTQKSRQIIFQQLEILYPLIYVYTRARARAQTRTQI